MFLILIIFTPKVKAHTFSANYNGKTIYYNIIDATTHEVEVTFRGSNYTQYNEYSGSISVPSTVDYNGITYTVTNVNRYAFSENRNLTNVILPNTVKSIEYAAFYFCTSLNNITIPEGVTYIGGHVFCQCHSLSNITLPSTLTTIDETAFHQCYALRNITIPSNVTTMMERTFSKCTHLDTVFMKNPIPPTIGVNPFELTPASYVICVPCGSLSAYQSAPNWSASASHMVEDCFNITDTICSGENYFNYGFSENTSGTYIRTSNDTTYILNLTVLESITNIVSATICEGESYLFAGEEKTEAGIYTQTTSSSFGCDSTTVLVLSVSNVARNTINATVCASESYIVGTHTYTNSGTYIDTLQTLSGCDSIITLNLSVNSAYDTTIYDTICEGESYTLNGFNESTAGEYTKLLASVSCCDSVIHLSLTVLPIQHTEINDTICEGLSYLFAGEDRTASGTYSDTLQAMSGCDSIITLTLVANPAYNNVEEITICQGETYAWNERTLSYSGYYMNFFTTASSACDSIEALDLTVNARTYAFFTESICNGEEYELNNKQYSTAGVYFDTIDNANNCDSIIVLNLSLNYPTTTLIDTYICSGETYNFAGQEINTTGTYTQILTSANGCDSIVTLDLTVNTSYENIVNAVMQQGEVYTDYGFYLTEEGTYTFTYPSSNYCDSTIIINLSYEEPEEVSSSLQMADKGDFAISVYPNPADNSIVIDIGNLKENALLLITDAQGRIMKQEYIPSGLTQKEIDVSNLASGVYYLRIQNNKTLSTQKIIKR